jgi:hypothetical protein
MKRHRARIPLAALLATFILLGCSADQHQKALRTSLTALNAAADGFIAFDADYQRTIVERAVKRAKEQNLSPAEGAAQAKADLAAYRERRDMVLEAFGIAYAALAAAALEPSPELLIEAAMAARRVYELYQRLRGGEPFEEVTP